jgi:uncharacterized delta-60 repeat protein
MADNNFRVNRGLSLNPQTTAPVSPVNGDTYYDSTLGSFVFYNNGNWINLSSQVDVASAATLSSAAFTAPIVQNSLVRITGSTASNVVGLAASAGGKQVVLYNNSTATVNILSNNSGEATLANRFSTPNDVPFTLLPGTAAVVLYDTASSRWRVISSGNGNGGAAKIIGGGTLSMSSVSGFNIGAGFNSIPSSVKVQPDGKIIVSGNFTTFQGVTRNRLVRLNSDGSLDTAFAANIGTGLDQPATGIAIQSDGKIVLGGSFSNLNGISRNKIVRLNSDGTVDTAFYTNVGTGINDGTVQEVFVQSNGGIIVAGSFTIVNSVTNRNRLVRYSSAGVFDTTFYSNTGGPFSGLFAGVAAMVQADDGIVVCPDPSLGAGTIKRFSATGVPDTTFNTNVGTGLAGSAAQGYAVKQQADSKIVIGGNFTTFNGNTRGNLIRLNSDGTEDTTFATAVGTAFNASIYSITVQTDASLVFYGSFTTFQGATRNHLVRLSAAGVEDAAFNANQGTGVTGSPIQQQSQVAQQPDGKLLVAFNGSTFNGSSTPYLVRLQASGLQDATTSGSLLSFTAPIYLEHAGLSYTDNTIATTQSPITFANNQQVAYVIPNLSTGGPSLTVSVSTLAACPINATIIARRDDPGVVVDHTRIIAGKTITLDSGVSNEILSAIAASSEADNTGITRLLANPTATTRVNVTSASKVVPDGTTYDLQVNNLLMSFNGAQIDFATGSVYGADGASALGQNFTPGTIAASQWLWYSVTLVANAAQVDNTISAQLVVIPASTTGATISAAPKAPFATGIPLGQVAVQKNAGNTALNAIVQSSIIQLQSSSGAAKATGFGGDDLDALQFRASFTDAFTEPSTQSVSSIVTSGTNAVFNTTKSLYQISYDATKTVTGSSVNMTLSGTPSFTVVAGDVLIQGAEARKIVTVTSQTVYVIESAFTIVPAPTAAQATVSQAIYTKDIYNVALDGAAISASFPGTTFSEIMVDYKDNATTGSNLWAPDLTPFVAFSATNDNTNFTVKQTRSTLSTDIMQSAFLPSAGSALSLRFFANATASSGIVNLLNYKVFMQKLLISATGGVMNQSLGITDNSATPVGMIVSVAGGKTTITLPWTYAVGSSGASSIEVLLNGSDVPRFVNSTLTPDASFLETSSNVITLDRDYSAFALSIKVTQRTSGQPVDSSTANTTNIAAQTMHQFKNALANSAFDIWQRGTSVAVANGGTAYQADRWYAKNSLGTSGVLTYSQVAGVSAGSKYGASVKITTAPTAAQANGCEFYQTLENFDTLPFINQTASFQVLVKGLGNVNAVGIQLFYSTSETKVTTAFGLEKSVAVSNASFSIGQLLAQSVGSLPTSAGVIGVRIRVLGVSTGNTYDLNNGFVVEQAQLNIGFAIPSFARSGRTTMEELAICQRYYETGQVSSDTTAAGTLSRWTLFYKVYKRTTATLTFTIIAGIAPSGAAIAVNNANGAFGNSNGGTVGDWTAWSYTADSEI